MKRLEDKPEKEPKADQTPYLGSGLQGRLVKGVGAQSFAQAVQIFIRLAEVPLLLSFWGPQLYGEWLMLFAITAFVSIGDGGFATTACREMTIRSGAGDRNGVQTIFQSTWLLLFIISIIFGLFGFIFVKFSPLHSWLGLSTMTIFESKATLLILVASVLISFQSELLNGGYWVLGRYPSGMFFIALTQFLEFAGLAVAVAFGKGPIHAALGYLSGRVVGTGFMWLGQRRASPWLRIGYSCASFMEVKRLMIPALASLAFPLGNALNIQGVRLIIGFVLGPAAVAVFVPMRTLSRMAIQPAIIISRLIQPELALAYGAEEKTLFKKIFNKSSQLSFWGCLMSCLVVGPGAFWIFPFWTGNFIYLNWPTYLILIATVFTNSIWYSVLMIPYSINQHRRVALYYFTIYGLFSFSLGFIGASSTGICGAALSLFLVELLMMVVVVYISLSIVRIEFFQWLATILRPPVTWSDKRLKF